MRNIIPISIVTILLTSCAVRLTEDKRTNLKNELEELVKADQITAYNPIYINNLAANAYATEIKHLK